MPPASISKTLWPGVLHIGLVQLALLLSSPPASASSGALPTNAQAPAGVSTRTGGSTKKLGSAAALLHGKSVLLSRGTTYPAVRLFMSARELPGDWPDPFRRRAGSRERYAEAPWTRNTRQQKRPNAIEKLWLLK